MWRLPWRVTNVSHSIQLPEMWFLSFASFYSHLDTQLRSHHDCSMWRVTSWFYNQVTLGLSCDRHLKTTFYTHHNSCFVMSPELTAKLYNLMTFHKKCNGDFTLESRLSECHQMISLWHYSVTHHTAMLTMSSKSNRIMTVTL